jgi:hypothetical protein
MLRVLCKKKTNYNWGLYGNLTSHSKQNSHVENFLTTKTQLLIVFFETFQNEYGNRRNKEA